MATFTVNGQSVTVEKNQKLIRYLRDTLHLTSVKDGCSEGACGTCHVLIDGKPTKACIPQTDKLEGKTIRVVGFQHGEFIDFDIEEALQMQKGINEYQFEVSHLLSI